MEPIRIVVADLPRLLRDILRASLTAEPDMLVVGEAESFDELERLMPRVSADVVILGTTCPELPPSHYRLFALDPRVRIIAITGNGEEASIYELRPHRVVLGQGSPQELRKAIRTSIRRARYPAADRPPAHVDPDSRPDPK